MTNTPHLEALAMRTRAAEVCNELASDKRASAAKYRSGSNPNWERTHDAITYETSALAILALPLESDPAALVREAAKVLDDLLQMRGDYYKCLTQDDAQMLWDAASKENGYAAVSAFLTALTALEQP